MQFSKMRTAAILTGVLGCAAAQAATVVNDTWLDSNRTDPAAPTYSEQGVDSDGDGNIESAWFNSGTSSTLVATPGSLKATLGTSSQSITNYFTSEASPITLANTNDNLKVTWRFTTGNVAATPTGQDFRFAVVDSPSATRITSDVTPAAGAYTGYAIFGNLGETFGNANPFQLRKRGTGGGALLSASGEYGSFSPNANDGASGNIGYKDNTQYEMVFSITRNAAAGLDLLVTMTQLTNLSPTSTNNLDNGTGLSVAVTDATPAAFTFDTFHFRPSSSATTSDIFDTNLFLVETFVPEPSSLALLGLGGASLLRRRRA